MHLCALVCFLCNAGEMFSISDMLFIVYTGIVNSFFKPNYRIVPKTQMATKLKI
jgi:hypothetical protein